MRFFLANTSQNFSFDFNIIHDDFLQYIHTVNRQHGVNNRNKQ